MVSQFESDCPASLVFLHIPKTGGTSLIQFLRSKFSATDCLTDGGNLSIDVLHDNKDKLAGGHLFYGHPLHNVVDHLETAITLTLMRRPEDHAISNYLFLQREPGLPLHAAAVHLSLREFLRVHWPCSIFQAISLDVAQSTDPVRSREDFFQRLPRIRALLGRIDFVGCLDQVDDFRGVLADALGYPEAEPILRLNAARDCGVDASNVAGLRDEYRSLRTDPALAALIAAEESLYRQAKRISARHALKARGRALWRRMGRRPPLPPQRLWAGQPETPALDPGCAPGYFQGRLRR